MWRLFFLATILISIVACRPNWLSDQNRFVKEFVDGDFLNLLGVILAITVASLSQAHLDLNRLEEKKGEAFLAETRGEMKSSAIWLIALFAASVILVILKPLAPNEEIFSAIFNSIAIFILGFYVFILMDVTMAVFEIKADLP